MKRRFLSVTKTVTVVVLLSLILFACGGRKKYVYSENIEVDFWGDIAEGEWIQIDDLKFVHVSNDSIGECDIIYQHDNATVNEANQSDSHYFMPSTEYYDCILDDKRSKVKLTSGAMAYSMVSALMTYGVDEHAYLYENKSNLLQVTQGTLHLKRTDGKKIKVYTSDNYNAAIRVVEPK